MGKLARSMQLHGGMPGWTGKAIEDALRLIVVMDNSPDITGGGQVTDFSGTVKFASGDPIDFEAAIGVGVFRDQYGAEIATGGGGITATITASDVPEGTWVYPAGGGAPAAVMKTTSAGRFKFKATKTSIGADTLWGKAYAIGTIAIDGTSADSVGFDA